MMRGRGKAGERVYDELSVGQGALGCRCVVIGAAKMEIPDKTRYASCCKLLRLGSRRFGVAQQHRGRIESPIEPLMGGIT